MKETEIREAWFRYSESLEDWTMRYYANSTADWWLALRAKELGELREKIVRASNHEQIRSGDADPWAVTQELLFILDELIEKP